LVRTLSGAKRWLRVGFLAAVAFVVAATLAGSVGGSPGSTATEGGTFRVDVRTGAVDTIDPALVDFPPEVQLLGPACGALMAYPNKRAPEGLRLRPDLAAAEPVVSKDGRTYTFTIRKDARFSSGARVTARDFAHTIARILDPKLKAYLASDLAAVIVGGEDVLAGKTTTPRGVAAKGRKLILRLTRRVRNILETTAQVCVVPASLSTDPEGAKAPLPSAAPFYVAEYVPGQRLVLERNRFYRGQRPHHLDRIVAGFVTDGDVMIDEIASGKVHFGVGLPAVLLAQRADEFRRRYGVNKSQFFVRPANGLRMYALNTSRQLFKNNPKLRQAVNFAVDRAALTQELGPLVGTPTDQYLSPAQPGYRAERIYPVKAPDLRRARKLARGNLRDAKAVLYTRSDPSEVALAQILQQNLKKIGLDLEIKQFPGQLLFDKLETEGKLFDIGRIVWFHGLDPGWFTDVFDGRTIGHLGNRNYSYFNSTKYDRLFDQASRLRGATRDRAFGKLDVRLSREAAPAIPVANVNALTFVSAQVGCIVINEIFDLTAACLKK
jgi:ABC-type transport system substrate-binding protein